MHQKTHLYGNESSAPDGGRQHWSKKQKAKSDLHIKWNNESLCSTFPMTYLYDCQFPTWLELSPCPTRQLMLNETNQWKGNEFCVQYIWKCPSWCLKTAEELNKRYHEISVTQMNKMHLTNEDSNFKKHDSLLVWWLIIVFCIIIAEL